MTDFEALFEALASRRVQCILVGGAAAAAHGSGRLTLDVDLVYSRDPENIQRVVDALASHNPYLRGAPPGLSFSWEASTVERGLNFPLTTALGDIDLLGELTGVGCYEDLVPHCIEVSPFGHRCLCLDLPRLILAKRAAGKPEDLEVIAELEVLLEEREARAERGSATSSRRE